MLACTVVICLPAQSPYACLAQEDDAVIWELLGHATRIWHIATGQFACDDKAVAQAAERIFGFWSSRQAWLVSRLSASHSKYLTATSAVVRSHMQLYTIHMQSCTMQGTWSSLPVLLQSDQNQWLLMVLALHV